MNHQNNQETDFPQKRERTNAQRTLLFQPTPIPWHIRFHLGLYRLFWKITDPFYKVIDQWEKVSSKKREKVTPDRIIRQSKQNKRT